MEDKIIGGKHNPAGTGSPISQICSDPIDFTGTNSENGGGLAGLEGLFSKLSVVAKEEEVERIKGNRLLMSQLLQPARRKKVSNGLARISKPLFLRYNKNCQKEKDSPYNVVSPGLELEQKPNPKRKDIKDCTPQVSIQITP